MHNGPITTINTGKFYKVYDDVVPQYLQDYIELIALGKKGQTEEVINPALDFKAKYEITAEEGSQTPLSFVHLLKSHTVMSPHLENFGMIPVAVCKHNNWTLDNILLARCFVSVPHETTLEHYAPHTDLNIEHTVMIYYVNDADGDTILFNDHGDVMQRVTPKKGRVLVFDGSILHGGGIPKKGPRCIVNYDVKVKK